MKTLIKSILLIACFHCFVPERLLGQTATPTATATNTATPLPGNCQGFTDTYPNSSSLSNYTYQDGSWNPSSASALDYSVTATGGELDETPASGSNVGSYLTVNSGLFNQSLSDYTVEADFKLDHWSSNYGLFGLIFREIADGQAYIFQLNGNPENPVPHWQLEKQLAPGGVSYTYLPGSGFGTGASSPVYSLGTWVHLKVVAAGNFYNCYVDPGTGPQLIFSVSDPGTPYATGGVGIRTTLIYDPNTVHIRNFQVSSCPSPSPYPGSNPPAGGTCFIYSSPASGNQATLAYDMAQAGSMDLKIWNEKAELAAHVTDQKPSGVQTTPFSISGFASGVYFYRVTLQYASGQSESLSPGKFVILH